MGSMKSYRRALWSLTVWDVFHSGIRQCHEKMRGPPLTTRTCDVPPANNRPVILSRSVADRSPEASATSAASSLFSSTEKIPCISAYSGSYRPPKYVSGLDSSPQKVRNQFCTVELTSTEVPPPLPR